MRALHNPSSEDILKGMTLVPDPNISVGVESVMTLISM